MEGYTNIIGSAYDFDDLDIESRVVDEWNQDEEKKPPRTAAPKWDEQAVLNERVRLDNGQQANVFSVTKKKDNSPLYICHICTDTLVGVDNLRQHAQGSKHRANMSKPFHPRAKFIKLDPKENVSLEPGEPVPPGLEEEIFKSCAIQAKLDDYKSPLVGLEFLVELTQSNSFEDEYYYCLLCEKTGSERNMFIHLTSVYHQLKYLSMYFPTVAKKLHLLPNKKMKKAFAQVIRDIIGDIEAKYGRMKPFIEPRMDFDAPGRMAELSKTVHAGPHFREKDGECFDEKATPQYLDKCALANLNAPPLFPPKPEKTEDTDEKKEGTGSMFNKINRVNVDKKQLRPREDDGRNSSPDVQIVDIQLPKYSPKMPMSGRKRRTRSRSLSSISNASSSSRGRLRYSRHHSRTRRRTRSRSRSRSRSPSRYRRRSPYYHRHSPSYRGRDRSPYRKRRYHSPHDRSRERERLDRYGRSREIYEARNDKYRREKETLRERNSPVMPTAEEKLRWETFREELKTIETLKLDKLKYYEKNPEQHPQYPNEWKTFWNQRYNELQKSGIDPSKHDFKPEWISFWTKRMKELYEEDLNDSKKELKKKLDLPDEVHSELPWKYKSRRRTNLSPGFDDVSPPTPDKKDVMADIKSTWKALTGSDIKDAPKRPLSPWEDDRSRSPTMRREQRSLSPTNHDKLLEDMPQRKTRTSSLIFVLRKLTVLEQQLGYLAPKVFELMHQALALEKVKEEASLDLLHDPDNAFYLETVREKLIALLCAGIVPRNMVNTARSAIKHIDISLHLVSKLKRVLPDTSLGMRSGILPDTSLGMHSGISAHPTMQYAEQAKPDPVIVPGVGQVDKVAIAQQIANALIEQGKTNVTEAELGQLINAVVGMAEASANSSQPMTTANFLQQLQQSQNANAQIIPPVNVPTAKVDSPVFQPISQETSNETSDSQTAAPIQQSAFGALKLLQSAYNEPSKTEQDSPKPEFLDNDGSKPDSPVSDDKLASTLAAFNNTPKEEQSNFIQKLKTSNPEMFKRLCPFIPVSSLISPDHSKRSPIIISLSKAKSEPKIKPVNSGRLSPFSSRSGGANPAVDEGVIEVDEDVKVISETSAVPQSLNESKENSTIISNKIDLDDEDEDDDYSYEDVYKAAQEKLKQNQLDKDQKRSKLTQDSVDLTKNDKPITTNPNKSHESGVDSQKNISLPIQTNLQQQRPNQNENNQNTQFSSQPIQEYDKFREIPSRVTQPAHYQNVPIQNYQEPMQRKPEAYQGYSNSEEYQNDSEYSFTNVDGYNNREQPSTDPYYSRSEFQSEDTYSSSYDGSYRNQSNAGYMNKQVTPEYGNNMNSYGNSMNPYGCDPYRQQQIRQQQPAYNAPNRAPWRPNFPAPPQRFPNSNYPPY